MNISLTVSNNFDDLDEQLESSALPDVAPKITILFDVDGTLIDTIGKYSRVDDRRLNYRAIPGGVSALKDISEEYLLGVLTSRSDDEAYVVHYTNREYRCALERSLDDAGYENLFKVILGHGKQNPYPKPDPRNFKSANKLVKKCGGSLDDAIYVGDSIEDLRLVQSAKKYNYNINFIGVLSGFTKSEDFVEHGCPVENIIPSIAHLQEYLEQRKILSQPKENIVKNYDI